MTRAGLYNILSAIQSTHRRRDWRWARRYVDAALEFTIGVVLAVLAMEALL